MLRHCSGRTLHKDHRCRKKNQKVCESVSQRKRSIPNKREPKGNLERKIGCTDSFRANADKAARGKPMSASQVFGQRIKTARPNAIGALKWQILQMREVAGTIVAPPGANAHIGSHVVQAHRSSHRHQKLTGLWRDIIAAEPSEKESTVQLAQEERKFTVKGAKTYGRRMLRLEGRKSHQGHQKADVEHWSTMMKDLGQDETYKQSWQLRESSGQLLAGNRNRGHAASTVFFHEMETKDVAKITKCMHDGGTKRGGVSTITQRKSVPSDFLVPLAICKVQNKEREV